MQCKTYSQKVILSNKDTLIGYTLNQNNFLIKIYYKYKEYKELDSLCETQVGKLSQVIHNDSIIQNDFTKLNKNNGELLLIKDGQISQLNTINKEQVKTIRRQKLYKWAVFAGGILTTGFVTYLFIIK